MGDYYDALFDDMMEGLANGQDPEDCEALGELTQGTNWGIDDESENEDD